RAPTELEVEARVIAGRDALALDARLHAANLPYRVLGERVAIHERLDERLEPRGDCGLARDGARFQERLELPGLRPTLVVRLLARRAAGEGALLALGSQVGVDAEGLTFRGDASELGQQLLGDLLGGAEIGRVLAVVDEEHVEVGCVAELGAAEAPHADDGERQRGPERPQRGLDARVGEPGELTLRGLDRGEPEDVARSDTEHLT